MFVLKPVTPSDKPLYETYFPDHYTRGCEFTFSNLILWGEQHFTLFQDYFVLFSRFGEHTVYPFPIGPCDPMKTRDVLEAVMADAASRGIPLYLTDMDENAKTLLETLYPDRFRIVLDRDAFEYVYALDDLADLAGKKYHRKRNHLKHFIKNHPTYTVTPLRADDLPKVKTLVDDWYDAKSDGTLSEDRLMEKTALERAFAHFDAIGMDGLLLTDKEEVLAFTMGSRLSEDTFDVQFEKARAETDGAYTAINYEFARYLRQKYPTLRYLDREEDLGLEGLRKSKLSYFPHHFIEKYYAVLREETTDEN